MAKRKGFEADLERHLSQESLTGLGGGPGYIDEEFRDGSKGSLSGLVAAAAEEWSREYPEYPQHRAMPPLDVRTRALEVVFGSLVATKLDLLGRAIFYTQSPIEELFFYGIAAACGMRSRELTVSNRGLHQDFTLTGEQDMTEQYVISIQHKVAEHHVDFMVRGKFYCGYGRARGVEWAEAQVAVECDGHDFHEKTKEQAKRDKRRDRNIAGAGMDVVRFSGSEIYANPIEHADWVLSHVRQLAFRQVWERRFSADWDGEAADIESGRFGKKILLRDTGIPFEEWKKKFKPGGEAGGET
jgi:hypothetical protein